MTGLLLSLALRFPKLMGFLSRWWKVLLIAGVVVGAWLWFPSWRDNLIESSTKAGFHQAEEQYTAAVEAANEKARQTQVNLDQMAITFGALASQREQAINLTLQPQIESIQREVQSDPRYRQCVLTDGVLDNLNAGRAAVDRSLAASDPE